MDGRPDAAPVLTRTGPAGPGPGLLVALVAGGILVAWRLDGGLSELPPLEALRPAHPTILGALYAPPPAATDARPALPSVPREPPRSWAAGRYVFDVDGRWFGVEGRLEDDP